MYYTTFSIAPLPPIVSIVPRSNVPIMAGQSLTLTCSAVLQEGISGNPTLMWTRDIDGVADFIVPGSLLTFEPLLTSHGGVYTCTARLTIPEAGVDVSEVNATTVYVQSMCMYIYIYILYIYIYFFFI